MNNLHIPVVLEIATSSTIILGRVLFFIIETLVGCGSNAYTVENFVDKILE